MNTNIRDVAVDKLVRVTRASLLYLKRGRLFKVGQKLLIAR